MVIPDIYSVCRILCSQCSHIHLSWTTQRTSLLKSVGLPGPSFTSPQRHPMDIPRTYMDARVQGYPKTPKVIQGVGFPDVNRDSARVKPESAQRSG